MTITLDIRPEIQAELARMAAVQGRMLEAVATTLLEQAVHRLPNGLLTAAAEALPAKGTGQLLIDACADIRALLTDVEIYRVFRRNPSTG